MLYIIFSVFDRYNTVLSVAQSTRVNGADSRGGVICSHRDVSVTVKGNICLDTCGKVAKVTKSYLDAEAVTVTCHKGYSLDVLIRLGVKGGIAVTVSADADEFYVGEGCDCRGDIIFSVTEEKDGFALLFSFDNCGDEGSVFVGIAQNKDIHS